MSQDKPEPDQEELDHLEALARKYSGGMVMVLLLDSGNWAIFDSARKLQGTGPVLHEAELARLSHEGARQYEIEAEPPAPSTLSPEELGL